MAKESTLSQNDRQAAIDEFRATHRISPNAEELIAANNASYSSALREASYLPVDEDKTDALEVESLGSKTTVSGKKVSDIGTPLSAAVRGHAVVVVIEQPDGNVVKEVIPHSKHYVAPKETPAEAAVRQTAMSNAALTKEVEELRGEMAAKLAELEQKYSAEAGKRISKAQSEADAAVAEAHDEAAKEAEEGSGEDDEGDEEKYPRTHDELDALLAEDDRPEGWSDMKVDDKIAHLQESGVKPE